VAFGRIGGSSRKKPHPVNRPGGAARRRATELRTMFRRSWKGRLFD